MERAHYPDQVQHYGFAPPRPSTPATGFRPKVECLDCHKAYSTGSVMPLYNFESHLTTDDHREKIEARVLREPTVENLRKKTAGIQQVLQRKDRRRLAMSFADQKFPGGQYFMILPLLTDIHSNQDQIDLPTPIYNPIKQTVY